jgi:putative hemolysin
MQSEWLLPSRSAILAGIADIPLEEIRDGRYEVRYARTAADLDRVLALRFEVFNLELGEGLASSFATGRDEDAFDAVCRHLMVVERRTGEVVGTYRLQTSAMAAAGCGFYSVTEFDLTNVPGEILADAIELGRACIARAHRSSRVLYLLWRGLAAYAQHNRMRYMFGCCSVAGVDPAKGVRIMRRLREEGYAVPTLDVRPRPGRECVAEAEAGDFAELPTLFKLYLRYGARVAGAPALDLEFGTIDFFVLFDVAAMPDAARKLFFGGGRP